jgi:DNA invertase Pin-like site-specific DNA recombinase
MMMQMVGSFAEFEREMIRERTKAGLDAARREGRIGGRRPKLSPEQRKDIIDNVLSERRTGAQMARLYKVSEATISRIIADKRNSSEAYNKRIGLFLQFSNLLTYIFF